MRDEISQSINELMNVNRVDCPHLLRRDTLLRNMIVSICVSKTHLRPDLRDVPPISTSPPSPSFSAAIAMADWAHGPQHVLIGQKIARRILGDPGSRACGSSTCGNLGLSFIGLNFFRRSLAFGIIQIGSSGRLCFCCVYGEHDGRSCQLQECYLLYQDLPAPGISRELISQEAH